MKKFNPAFLSVLFLLVLLSLPNSVSAKDEWLQVRSKKF